MALVFDSDVLELYSSGVRIEMAFGDGGLRFSGKWLVAQVPCVQSSCASACVALCAETTYGNVERMAGRDIHDAPCGKGIPTVKVLKVGLYH